MRFAVNLAFLFTDRPFLDRFQAAADAGFGAVEFPWPDDDPAEVTAAAVAAGVTVVQMNAHAGDLTAGDRGYANDPSRIGEWREAVERAVAWSGTLGFPAVNLLVGNRLPGSEGPAQWRALEANLGWALGLVEGTDTRLLVEVLNDRDTPAYLLTRLADGAALVRSFSTASLRLQYDTYHVGLMEGDLVAAYRSVADLVGHVQIADVPGRHEPGTGNAHLGRFLRELEANRYGGVVSLEYVPTGATEDSLGWLAEPARTGMVDVGDLPLR